MLNDVLRKIWKVVDSPGYSSTTLDFLRHIPNAYLRMVLSRHKDGRTEITIVVVRKSTDARHQVLNWFPMILIQRTDVAIY